MKIKNNYLLLVTALLLSTATLFPAAYYLACDGLQLVPLSNPVVKTRTDKDTEAFKLSNNQDEKMCAANLLQLFKARLTLEERLFYTKPDYGSASSFVWKVSCDEPLFCLEGNCFNFEAKKSLLNRNYTYIMQPKNVDDGTTWESGDSTGFDLLERILQTWALKKNE